MTIFMSYSYGDQDASTLNSFKMNRYIQSGVECYLPASKVKHLPAGASVDHNIIFGHFNLVAFARNILNEVLRDNLISNIIA